MKRYLAIFLALAASAAAQNTPTHPYQYNPATKAASDTLNFSAGELEIGGVAVTNTPAWSAITGTPTTLAGYGITDPIALTSGSYANPSWITSLAWSKITGTPTSAAGYGIANGAQIDTWGTKASPAGTVVGTSDTQTLTNKSIDADQLTGTIAAARLPNPAASSLGGIESITSLSHNWVAYIDTSGVPHQSQPAFTDISGVATAAQIPTPTTSAIGGVEAINAVSHEWVASISTAGVPSLTQPAASDLSNGVTGSGAVALANSPSFTTPSLGAATATSVNGLTLTANATGFSVAGGTTSKTMTWKNSLTMQGTDGTTFTFPGSSDTVDVLGTAQTFTAVKTFTNSDLDLLGSSTGYTTFTSANSGSTNYTITVPAITDTLATLTATQTFTNKSIAGSEINSGTVSGTYMAAVNLAAGNVNGGVTGTLPVGNGGTGAATFASNNILTGNVTSAIQASGATITNSGNQLNFAGGTFLNDNGSGQSQWRAGGTGAYITIAAGSNGGFTIAPAGSGQALVNTNTTSSSTPLHVTNSADYYSYVQVDNGGTDYSSGFKAYSWSSYSYLVFDTYGSTASGSYAGVPLAGIARFALGPVSTSGAIFNTETSAPMYFATHNTQAMEITTSQIVEIVSSTASTSTTTGAETVTGGLGVGGAGFFGAPVVPHTYTVSGLPSASTYSGGLAVVSDSTSSAGTNVGSAPTGGGSNVRAVYSTGSAWLQL